MDSSFCSNQNSSNKTEVFPLKMNTICEFELEEGKQISKPNLLRERLAKKRKKEEQKKQPKKILKIADFGLSRSCSVPVNILTNEVITLWYRSPELLLGSSKYNVSCDIWSIGCIFAEMVSNRPIFMGKNAEEQLDIIFEIRGSPENKGWSKASQFTNYVVDKWTSKTKSLKEILGFLDPNGKIQLFLFI